MHTGCCVLGSEHPRFVLQERALVDIVCDHTNFDRLRIASDALTRHTETLNGSYRKARGLSGLRHWRFVSTTIIFQNGRLTEISVTFASVYRATTIAASASDPDPTWGPIPATVWSVIEANAGIVCACLPMLRSPFVRLFGPVFGRSRKRTTKPYGSCHLTGRGDKPHASAAVSSRRIGAGDTVMDPERDSEEVIVTSESGAVIQDRGTRVMVRGRSPSGIFVRKEFSVDDNLSKMKSDGDRSTVGSHIEDKSHGKAPFSYV